MNWLWRSLLFVPGSRPERFAKAFAAGADAVCVDLEDAVPPADKDEARRQVVDALSGAMAASSSRANAASTSGAASASGANAGGTSTSAASGQPAAVVRLNAVQTPWHADDLRELSALPDEVVWMLPKADLDGAGSVVQAAPQRKLIALLEDARGIEQAYAIAQLPGVVGLMLGGADLAANLGAQMEWEPLLYARSRLVMAAASAGCLALDVPCLDLKDTERVFAETQRIKALGYDCKAAIHPLQVEPINRAMTSSAAEVERAQRMIAVFEEAGGGAVEFEGIMLDEPVIIAARRTLSRAG